ncbi:MAG: pantetheine-phosphate adenylyltransferase [Planctomycetes bacterium]|nr:pantetheine-phosphate adenylyltransferase [Planctomycetota bacterium]
MKTGIYAGTFDPMTAGHFSVIERAARLFDRLIVLVAVNPAKRPLFSVEERVAMIRESVVGLGEVEVSATEGMVIEFARRVGAGFLVRGIRSLTDFDSETAMAAAHHSLAPEISTVFVPAHPDLSFVSSSALRELARCGADVTRFCPPGVARRLREKMEVPRAAV